jgi:cytochrome P450
MARLPLPPGPPGHFLLGHIMAFWRDPLSYTSLWAKTYGDVVRLRLGTLVVYQITHPDDIEWVLRGNHRKFRKDRMTRNLSSLLGKGLLTSEGEVWRRQRRLAQPAFQTDQIEKYSKVMVDLTQRLLADWQPGQTRDVHADMMRLALEIVGQTLFGAQVGDMADEVGRILEVGMAFFASPMSLFPRLYWLPLPGNIRFRRACRQLDALMYKTIAQRRASGGEGEDLLSRLLAVRDDDGTQMSDAQLRDELITLFLAGHETTALAMSFTFYLLAQHPDVVARLELEVDEVLQGRPATAADVPNLRYTEWVIREAMRLYPPAPGIGREALEDCQIRGFFVPKGTQISLVQWVVQRDSRWYDHPDEFRPERWDNDLARRLPRGAYFPFGDGPRICIGMQFAMMETVLILATLAQRYRLDLAPGYVLDLAPSVTLRPKQGVRLVVRPRPQTRRAVVESTRGLSPSLV